jgi:ferritin-like metal-binding protein YciE
MEKLVNLKDLLEHELKDLYSAEKQLTEALPKMAQKANSENLKNAFEEHLNETQNQCQRLEEIAGILNMDIEGEKCKAMEGLIKEGKEFMEMKASPEVMDAGLIAEAQRVEHYEIAGYGTACTYAKMLGMEDVLAILKETLKEEKGADEKLTELAMESINEKAESSHE